MTKCVLICELSDDPTERQLEFSDIDMAEDFIANHNLDWYYIETEEGDLIC